jgi:hypothetical protein
MRSVSKQCYKFIVQLIEPPAKALCYLGFIESKKNSMFPCHPIVLNVHLQYSERNWQHVSFTCENGESAKDGDSHEMHADNFSSGPSSSRIDATGHWPTSPTKFIVKMHLYIIYILNTISGTYT